MQNDYISMYRKAFLKIDKLFLAFILLYCYSVTFWVFNSIYQYIKGKGFVFGKLPGTGYEMGRSVMMEWSSFVNLGLLFILSLILINLGLGVIHFLRNKQHWKSRYFMNVINWFLIGIILSMSFAIGALFIDVLNVFAIV